LDADESVLDESDEELADDEDEDDLSRLSVR
jgi:hypothetical protein